MILGYGLNFGRENGTCVCLWKVIHSLAKIESQAIPISEFYSIYLRMLMCIMLVLWYIGVLKWTKGSLIEKLVINMNRCLF